jgi:hypothetical protein
VNVLIGLAATMLMLRTLTPVRALREHVRTARARA